MLWVQSTLWAPKCCMGHYQNFLTMISLAWISMSAAWPWAPPNGWWIMIRLFGRLYRFPWKVSERSWEARRNKYWCVVFHLLTRGKQECAVGKGTRTVDIWTIIFVSSQVEADWALTHRCSKTDTHSGNIWANMAHGVEHSHPGSDRTTGGVDVYGDILEIDVLSTSQRLLIS